MSIKTLTRQRAACLGTLTKMKNFVDLYSESENSVSELIVRQDSLEQVRLDHGAIIKQLLEIVEDDFLDELDVSITKFDNAYFSVKALLSTQIVKFSPAASSMEDLNLSGQSHIQSHGQGQGHYQSQKTHVLKVPDIKIPTFNDRKHNRAECGAR